MKTIINSTLGLFLISLLLGCGSDYSLVPVSGTVTVDGKPEGGIKLYFSPVVIGDNPTSGPYSTAVTDESGRFVLESRDGSAGAVVGKHRALFSYADAGSVRKALVGPGGEEASKRMREMMKAKGVKVRRDAQAAPAMIVVSVPSGGTETLNFELTSRKIK